MENSNKKTEFDLIQRCGAFLQESSTIKEIHEALDEVLNLCWYRHFLVQNFVQYDLLKLPAYHMNSKCISTLLIINNKTDARLVSNITYFEMMTNLLVCPDLQKWEMVIDVETEEHDKKVTVHFHEGVIKNAAGDILLPLAYLTSLCFFN